MIQLTPDEVDNWGRATYSEQMHLWDKNSGVANFTSNFSFIIYSRGKDKYSDGLMFFLSTLDFPDPNPTNGPGLGLVSGVQMGQRNFLNKYQFVAVEFAEPPPHHTLSSPELCMELGNIPEQRLN
ncbi:bark lectin-like [Quercus lobata]|uniref:Legume lectin domain-containing protein n=1 Tax=Quercus lobata TaxID=97700 RepID=A0A7N2LZX2_QUELO|nr:bark lectin-like [Quercus lobata]